MAECICAKCGYQGKKKAILPGSGTTELVLWVVFLIPGPFYTIWRRIIARKWGCPHCEEQTMVSLDTLVGKTKLKEINKEIAPEELKKIPSRWQDDIEEYNKKNDLQTEAVDKNVMDEPTILEPTPPVEEQKPAVEESNIDKDGADEISKKDDQW